MQSLGALTALGALQAFALAVFMLGFFLTRQEVPHHSHCQDAALWDVVAPAGCWSATPRPRFRKAVVVVIDALRFDFLSPWGEDEVTARVRKEGTADAAYHLNKMPLVRELLARDPARALLYRFEADPPTTTVQRLKGLTTGSLPTFLDFRQNFHTHGAGGVGEDNLIQQLRQAGKRLTVMGDDTWELLFPGAFHRSFPFPSFNTRDLDGVDNGVQRHLVPELKQAEEWDVLIAHFLGVDHVGHTFGPSHRAMETKLAEMDKALQEVVEVLGNDTLLVLMGDHGMTDDGNHGGATVEETEAALFLYSPGGALVAAKKEEEEVYVWSSEKEAEGGGLTPTQLRGGAVARRVAQVDLVPTLALLLGVAVPYQNLGGIIPELFFHHPKDHEALAHAFHANAHQLNRYLQKYAEVATLPAADMEALGEWYRGALRAHKSALGLGEEKKEKEALLRVACQQYRRFLTEALDMGRRVWTQYDLGLMMWGVLLLATSLVWGVVMSSLGRGEEEEEVEEVEGRRRRAVPAHGGSPAHKAEAAVSSWVRVLRLTLGALGVALLVSWLFPAHFLQHGDHAATVIPCLVLSLVLLGVTASLLRQQETFFSSSSFSPAVGCSFVLVVLHGVSLFSNSYIEGEEKTYLFLTGSAAALVWLIAQHANEEKKNISSTSTPLPTWLLPALLARLAFDQKGHGQDVTSHFHLLTTLGPLVGLLVGYHHVSMSSSTHPRTPRRVVLLGLAYLLLLAYWIIQVDAQDLPVSVATAAQLVLPRLLYLASFLSFLFCLFFAAKSSRALFCLDVAALLSPPLLLVLGPVGCWSLLCLGGSMQALRRLTSSSSSSSFPYLVTLSFLGRTFFFATGHHSQFNRLQYSAAFVGFEEFDFMVGGALLFLNTFGTELFTVLLLAHNVLSSSSSSSSSASLRKAFATLLHLSAFKTLLTTLCVLLQRRHLMVWAIFAPKFIFDAALHVVLSGASLALLWMVEWKGRGRRRGEKSGKLKG